ncbi:MAG: MtrB/PioB family decaheme-associated outer membrane protein [Deltaproteobacteria bacterium]|nr:MtrB/PioB family decaheme-associated outer membrane protein [Deltaproteobacteria bacterium]
MALLVGAGLLLGGPSAVAQLDLPDHTVKGEGEFGVRQIYGSHGSSKFEEYRHIPSGLFLDRLRLGVEDKEQRQFYELRVTEPLERDQNYQLRAGRYGRYAVQFEWDQLPHVFSNTGRSLFRGGADDLTIPSLVRSTLQSATTPTANTATINTTVNENAQGIDLRLQRKTATLGASYTPTPGWDVQFSYGNEHREGTRPFGANIRTNNTSGFNTVELPEPTDYRTHDVRAQAEYTADRWSVAVGYVGSIFNDDHTSLTWDNPFRTTDSATLGAARGRHALPPDNIAHTASLSGSLNVAQATRLMGTISYGWWRQDEPFLPKTTNSLLSPSALPAASLDGKINTLLMNYTLNTRLHRDVSLTARYRYYLLDNNTPERIFDDYVQADSSVVTTDRRNLAIAYTNHNAGLDVGWRPVSVVSVKAGYGFERFDREKRDANITNEHSGKGAVDVTPIDWLLLRASYLYSQRRFDEYDHEKFVGEHTFPSGEPAGTLPQHPNLRKFDLANRNRNRVELLGQLTPFEPMTISATYGLGKDDFKDVGFGITSDNNWSAGLDVFYRVSPRVALFTNYTREEFKSKMRSRQRGGAAGDTAANDWASDMTDIVDTVGAGVDVGVIPERLDLTLAYSIAVATGQVRARPLGTPTVSGFTAENYPDTKNRLHQLKAALKYHLGENLTAKLSYTFERFVNRDFQTDIMDPWMGAVDSGANSSIFLGARQPSYEAHFVALSLSFRF